MAVVLVLYSEIWSGQPLLVLAKGLMIWLPLGLTVVGLRLLLDAFAHRLAGGVLGNHVLEIRAFTDTETHELGPNYHTLGVIPVDSVPEDVEGMESWLAGGIDTLLIADQIPDDQFRHLTDFALTHGCSLLSAVPPHERMGIESRRTWLKGRPFEVRVVSELGLNEQELDGFNMVWLCNVGVPQPDVIERLEHFAAQGGGVVFFLGNQVGKPR